MLVNRKEAGTFVPDEVDLICRVLKRLSVEKLERHKREALAQRVMANYMAGITDEDDLVSWSKQPLGR